MQGTPGPKKAAGRIHPPRLIHLAGGDRVHIFLGGLICFLLKIATNHILWTGPAGVFAKEIMHIGRPQADVKLIVGSGSFCSNPSRMRKSLLVGACLAFFIPSPYPEAGMSITVWQCINCGDMERYKVGTGAPSRECPNRYWNGRWWMPRMCDYRKRYTRTPNYQ